MRLENKVAIVTGAGRNIGEDIAKTSAQEGARVAVVDLDKGRGQRVAGEINDVSFYKLLTPQVDLPLKPLPRSIP